MVQHDDRCAGGLRAAGARAWDSAALSRGAGVGCGPGAKTLLPTAAPPTGTHIPSAPLIVPALPLLFNVFWKITINPALCTVLPPG